VVPAERNRNARDAHHERLHHHRHQPSRDDTHVILGVKANFYGGFDYVTARVLHLTDHQWFWGHYFSKLNDAVADFNDRSYPELPVGSSSTATTSTIN
jgi:hypothetical protein